MQGQTLGRREHRRPSFAPSKFLAPVAGAVRIPRRDLCSRLDDAGDRVRLVIGSPGSGKTSLLSEWFEAQPAGACCWLSADRADTDAVRFWFGFLAAVRTVRADFGQECLDLLALDERVDHDFLESLLAAVEGLGRPVSVIIDDFHLVGSEVNDQLQFLLRRGFERLQLVIGTRVEPAIGLHRLRLEDRLSELREADLRFSAADGQRLLQSLDAPLPDGGFEIVMDRTEGWAAGLLLAAVALRDLDQPDLFVQRLTGSNQVISQYLWSEVYAAQNEATQRFLLDTCIVDELSPALAAALSPGTAVTLYDIEAANLLIRRVDPGGTAFRYHQLLIEMLRSRLRATDPKHELELHERAGRWYVDQGDLGAAFGHRWRAGQRADALEAMHATVLHVPYDDTFPSMTEAERTLTDDDLRAAPGPAVSYCVALLVYGFVDEAERLAARLEAIPSDALSPAERLELLAIRITDALGQGDTRACIELGARLPEPDSPSAISPWYLFSRDVIARAHMWEDNPRAAAPLGHLVGPQDPLVQRVEASNTAAQLLLTTGDLTECSAVIERTLEELEREGLNAITDGLLTHAVLGAVLLDRGDLAGAELHLRRVSDTDLRFRVPAIVLAKVALCRAWSVEGHHDAALLALDDAYRLVRARPPRSGILDHIRAQHARLMADIDDFEEAFALCDTMAPGRRRSLLSAHLELRRDEIAAARHHLEPHRSDSGTAREALELAIAWLDLELAEGEHSPDAAATVFELAAPEGFILPIVEAGPAVLPEVQRVARQRVRTPYVDSLMRTRPRVIPADRAAVRYPVEALTERERMVLRYLATSLSYAEIASALYVSINTVKTHAKNINVKLQAASRADAVERARQLRYV